MDKGVLINAIKASSAHKKTNEYIRQIIKPGLNLKDIAILIENKIKEETNFDINNPLNGGIGFPVGLSLNNCAAHYTPNYNETNIILKENDILKIDYGTHIYGTIIDSAFTLHFDPKYDEFIQISKNITNFIRK
jgi:methionyl aminopeptidase